MNKNNTPKINIPVFISVVFAIVSVFLLILYGIMYTAELRIDPNSGSFVSIKKETQEEERVLILQEGERIKEYSVPYITDIIPSDTKLLFFYTPENTVVKKYADREFLLNAIKDFTESVSRNGITHAYITEDCKFVPSEQGNKINIEKLSHDITGQFPECQEFNIEDYYIKEEDYNEKSLQELIHKLEASHISYDNGDIIKASDMEPVYNISTNSISLNRAMIKEAAKDISLKYDTAGNITIQFNSTLQGEVTVKGGTWGSVSDSLKEMDEAEALLSDLRVSDNRIPVLKQSMPPDIPDTYIEVDKENQKVFVYENKELVMSSDCVTGRPPSRSTPSGIYFISERMTDKTLRGPGYSSFVRRWMRLTNSGVGLHDASWRSSFGNDIYVYNGSHGCINLPKDFAYQLYEWTGTHKNTCVVIF